MTTTPEKKDKTKVGCALPKVTYGWNNTLTYKKWALTAFFQGNIGNKIMNATRAHYSNKALLSAGKNVLADALKDKYFTSDNTYYYPSDRYLEMVASSVFLLSRWLTHSIISMVGSRACRYMELLRMYLPLLATRA